MDHGPTCPGCQFDNRATGEAAMNIKLSCASCPWTWRGTNIIQADAMARAHERENQHCVMDESDDDLPPAPFRERNAR